MSIRNRLLAGRPDSDLNYADDLTATGFGRTRSLAWCLHFEQGLGWPVPRSDLVGDL